MVHCLATIAAGVDHATEPLFGEAFLLGNPAGHDHELPHDVGVLISEVSHALHMLAGNQQDVVGGGGVDVAKCIQLLVAINPGGGNFACGDLAEHAITGHFRKFSCRERAVECTGHRPARTNQRSAGSCLGCASSLDLLHSPVASEPILKSSVFTAVLFMAALPVRADVPVYHYEIVRSFPHSTSAFSQGLLIHDGYLYEGTGQRGRSSLSRIDLESGEVLQSKRLGSRYFGEGIAVVGRHIYQLTWQSNIAFVYDVDTFDNVTSHYYPTEGWGLTWDGTHLILSDGSDTLQFLDPETFQVQHKVSVHLEGNPVRNLNELEYINGEVWANVWMTEEIVRIDPVTGQVNSVVDLSGLVQHTTTGGSRAEAVLNGIAWLAAEGDDPADGRLFVTGKLWGNIFEIELIPAQ